LYICAIKLTKMNSLNIFLLGMPGGPSMILIIVALLLLFGGKKIPELMKGIGGGLKEFKKAAKEESKEDKLEDKK
jgi:sec-independent protein translocase protein TatA